MDGERDTLVSEALGLEDRTGGARGVVGKGGVAEGQAVDEGEAATAREASDAQRDGAVAVSEHPIRVHHPDHMKGWEAFGGSDGVPTVRRLGSGADGKSKPGTIPFARGETKLGVCSIETHSYADAPDAAYIYVVGVTEEDARRAWNTAAIVWAASRDTLWPKSRP